MLLIGAAIWGSAFVAQDVGMNYVGPYTFNALRYFVGALTHGIIDTRDVERADRRCQKFRFVGCRNADARVTKIDTDDSHIKYLSKITFFSCMQSA